MPLDLLLVHVPKFRNFYAPMGSFVLGNLPAMGLFSIADHLDRAGQRVRIVHLGVEALSDSSFRLADHIGRAGASTVGFSLHWHYQLPDVLDQARELRARRPDVRVVLGGMTATLLAEALLAGRAEVDFIIRGEGEEPVAALLRALDAGADLATVPNLSWRDTAGRVRHNSIGFVADRRFLDEVSFHRFDLLDHADLFLSRFNHVLYLRSFPGRNRALQSAGTMGGYMVPVGRGCPVDCSYCGGGRSAARRDSGRARVTLRSYEAVLRELAQVRAQGIDRLYFAQDPYPHANYYPRLFGRIVERGLRFQAVFESFRLPTPAFLDAFEKAFGKGSGNLIVLSPETGDEALRARNRGYPYTNAELLACLEDLSRRGLRAHVSYTLGLPGETWATLERTRELWGEVERRWGRRVRQSATLIHLDPGSPAERDPAAHGIVTRARTLDELLALHRTSADRSLTGWSHLPLGHGCPDLADGAADPATVTDRVLRAAKCRHFCHYFGPLGLPYPAGRAACALAGFLLRAHRRLLETPIAGMER